MFQIKFASLDEKLAVNDISDLWWKGEESRVSMLGIEVSIWVEYIPIEKGGLLVFHGFEMCLLYMMCL